MKAFKIISLFAAIYVALVLIVSALCGTFDIQAAYFGLLIPTLVFGMSAGATLFPENN